MNEKLIFGHKDNSYQLANGEEGLMQLSKDFYYFMDTLPEAKVIRAMHKEDLTKSIEKLALFLCGWLGGPRRFQEKFGPIHIPQWHSFLNVGEAEKEIWLRCMERALEKQPYDQAFKDYLLAQLRIPASKIQEVSQMRNPKK